MATDFWASSHHKRWMVDRATLKQARIDDQLYATEEQLSLLGIFFANVIWKLGKKLQLRQRAIATATVFFRRFYLKNSYCETDPFLVAAACCYVASKAEETPVHVKTAVSEARALFTGEEFSIKTFPSDNSKLAEMEFYLVDELECDLVVFHPYRTLLAICGKEVGKIIESEIGEVGAGIDEGARYWGTGSGRLDLQDHALQIAWFVINDSYRSDLSLIYPPHLLAVAAVYLALVLHKSTRQSVLNNPGSSSSRRSSRHNSHSADSLRREEDPIAFLSGLNVSTPLIATIIQGLLDLYALWARFKDDAAESAQGLANYRKKDRGRDRERTSSEGEIGEVTSLSLTQLVIKMREQREADLAHPPTAKPIAVNKMLERAQAAG